MNKSKKGFIWLPLVIAISIVVGIFIGTYFNRLVSNGINLFPTRNKIDNLINLIDNQYVDTINKNSLIESTLPMILKGLDPHSEYIPAKDLASTNEELEGSFSGIGVQFNLMNDTISVVGVIPGGPSEKVGIMPGDRIVSINDSAFVGKKITTDMVMKKLRGAKGAKVNIGVKRSSSKNILPFEITRGDIPVNSVDVAYMLDDKSGYIKVSKFGRTTYDEFLNALAKLKKNGATGYVIDLRGNSGGYMDAAINMINEFLPKGQLIVYTEGKAYPRNDAVSNGTGSFQNTPIVVLTDEWSASASEIFAGAIQDNDRGMIIGRRTFGKGLVQQQIPFSDGSAVRLTIAHYYTPSGRSIQRKYKLGEKEEYYQDLTKRFLHGEFDSQDSIKQIDSLRFETLKGRTVYGGGGIMPDIFIPRDTAGYTSYLNNVVNTGVIYQFAFNYTDQHREQLSKYKDYKSLLSYLQTQPLLNEFVAYAQTKGIKPRPVYINISKDIINNLLYSYIERNMLGEEAFYPVFQSNDKTLQQAIEILNKNKSFPEITAETITKK